MSNLKLFFCDFFSDFIVENDFFYKLLSRKYKIVLDRQRPDFLIYSCYGHEFFNYDCPRVFYTAENLRPDFNLCDYAIGFDCLDFGDRYCRFPNFARYGKQFEALVKQAPSQKQGLTGKTAFCNFIYSNAFADPVRDRFFHLLSKYKRVDSHGKHLNNMPSDSFNHTLGAWAAKVELQRPYKFSIAFENSSAPGYTTEKILHAFIADTVPIYWGNPLITREFNPKAFVNCHDFENLEAVVRRVAELDSDDEQYLAMLNEPCFYGNVIPEALREETLLNFFTSIFSQPPVAAYRRPRHGTTVTYEIFLRKALELAARKDAFMRLVKSPLRPLKAILKQ